MGASNAETEGRKHIFLKANFLQWQKHSRLTKSPPYLESRPIEISKYFSLISQSLEVEEKTDGNSDIQLRRLLGLFHSHLSSWVGLKGRDAGSEVNA